MSEHMVTDRAGNQHQPPGIGMSSGEFAGRTREPAGVTLEAAVPDVPDVPGGWKNQALRQSLDQRDRDVVEWFDADEELKRSTFTLLRQAAEADDHGTNHRRAAEALGWDVKMVAREEIQPGDLVIAERDKDWEHGRAVRSNSSYLYAVHSPDGPPPASRSHLRGCRAMTSYDTTRDSSVRPNEVQWSQAYDPEVSSGCSLYRVRPRA